MQIQFDSAKDAANRAKHGISLGEAARMDWDTAFVWVDNRFDYGEMRMAGWGYIGLRLFHVAFVDRGDIRRIISLRRAGKYEEKQYASTQTRSYFRH